MKQSRFSTRYMAAVAMFAAVSFVAVLLAKVIPNVAGFLSYEPKDAVIVIAGLLYGPLTSVLISVIVSFIEMITISTTGPYGFLMNMVSTCAFAAPAAWFYQKHRTQKGAVIGLAVGMLTMVAAMLLWNYIITPFYMGVPRETVAGMLMSVFLPFNQQQWKRQLQPWLHAFCPRRAGHVCAAVPHDDRCVVIFPKICRFSQANSVSFSDLTEKTLCVIVCSI